MLSKSDIQSYLQCPRKLWLERNRQDLVSAGDPATRRREMDGNAVAEKARLQLADGFIWPPAQDNRQAAASEARRLLDATPNMPAVEVPMLHERIYARADALIPYGAGYVLQETKASTYPLKADKVTTGTPKDHHLNELAIQAWVMSGSGLSIERAELNLLNGQWRYPGDGDYSGLFRQLDVTDDIAARVYHVQQWRDDSEAILVGEMPELATGKQCSDPYACPYLDHCQRLDPPGPEHPIELLPDAAGKSLARTLREQKGYVSILEPEPEELTGKQSELYQRIQEAHRIGRVVWVAGSAERLAEFAYPRYYFDFEGIDLPIPRWAGVRPYEQIPFQWSCHVEREPSVFEHEEFLDLSGNDPSLNCIRRMSERISPDDGGPIFVYHATYEKGRLQELAERHPDHAPLLQKYIDRVVDLLPLVKQYFYHPDMQGSFSIKKVLPVIAPDLDYRQLEDIREGTGAQIAYIEAAFEPNVTPERLARIDETLKAYCRQDTWAMVEIAYFLARAGRPVRPSGM